MTLGHFREVSINYSSFLRTKVIASLPCSTFSLSCLRKVFLRNACFLTKICRNLLCFFFGLCEMVATRTSKLVSVRGRGHAVHMSPRNACFLTKICRTFLCFLSDLYKIVATRTSKLVYVHGRGHAVHVSPSATLITPLSIIAHVTALENIERTLQNP